MRCPRLNSFLIVAAVLLTGGPAFAAMPLSAVGVLQQYCADEAVAPHPEVVVLEQPVMTDDLATFGGSGFVAQYTRDDGAAIEGVMVVRIKVRRLDGKTQRIGKIVARQVVPGVAAEGEYFPVAVRQGETLIWKYRFRNFEPPAANECVLVLAAVGDASLAGDE